MGIGDQIRAHRKQLGLTQAQLAKLVGVTDRQVRFWERGADEPGGGRLAGLATALHTTTDILCGRHPAIALFAQEQKLRDAKSIGKTPPHQNEEALSLRLRAQQIHDRLAKSMMDVQEANHELQRIIARLDHLENHKPTR